MATSGTDLSDEKSLGSDMYRLVRLADALARISARRRLVREEGSYRELSRLMAELDIRAADDDTTNLWSIVRTSTVAELEQLFKAGIIDIGDAMTSAEAALRRTSAGAADAVMESSVLLEEIQTRSGEIDRAQQASRRLIEELIDGR